MSNFAERLVARSAGAPPGPGISVLTLRPASRFEPATALDIETEAAPATADIATTMRPGPHLETAREIASFISQDPAEADVRKPAGNRETAIPAPPDDMIRRPGHTEPIVRIETQKGVAPVPPSGAKETVPKPIRTKPDASNDLAKSRDASQTREPAEALRPEIPWRSFNSEPTSSQTPHMPAIREADSGRPLAPVISIGKIEVQFLPQEPRLATMPQPQRTRGFEAYARARRGEPR